MPTTYRPALDLQAQFIQDKLVSRIWDRDISVWGAARGTADAKSIENRLGWLETAKTMRPQLSQVEALGEIARTEGVQAVYLLGMGGSSLCAEVLKTVLGTADGSPELYVLDTTDEQTITAALSGLTPARTWFLVASKSGGTVEVASMERLFWARVQAELGEQAGRQFVAITDPGTALEALARSRGYREAFINPPDIGGRFSALSLFGLVPTALIGRSSTHLLITGENMADGCRQENATNPGLALGAFIGAAARNGRDKLTVVLPPSLASLGLWIEQLVAESTGKHGKGALPVVDEVLGRPDEYGRDRAFVAITTDRDTVHEPALEALAREGHPVLHLSTRVDALGAEFFRWEFATAVAGAALGINPFDEPNVSEAKEKTGALLGTLGPTGQLSQSAPVASSDAVDLFSTRFRDATPEGVVRAALTGLQPPDYVAFLSYLPPGNDVARAVATIRAELRTRHKVASTFGVGPRYLHSTGQYHKGGPNTAVAFVLTAEDETRTEIPGAGYSLSVLKRAQALGDTETLDAHGRRTVRIHVKDAGHAATTLETLFERAMR
jgi:glucose-6-phosphate isomerase/transaldolase/glucose-6-phosphate isomerase